MMKVFNKLECVVRFTAPKSSKVKVATELAIFIGPMLIATKVVGGRYTAEQGLQEFKRLPKTFKQEGSLTVEQALTFKAAA